MRRPFSILVIVVALLTFTAPVIHAKPSEWTTICYHYVRPGETIYCIARAYGVDPCAITAHNGIVNPNTIHPGQQLAIPNAYASVPAGPTCARQCYPYPDPYYPCTCASYHTITCGENLYRISVHYGVNMWHIARCNHIYNMNYIRAGDVLCIPIDP